MNVVLFTMCNMFLTTKLLAQGTCFFFSNFVQRKLRFFSFNGKIHFSCHTKQLCLKLIQFIMFVLLSDFRNHNIIFIEINMKFSSSIYLILCLSKKSLFLLNIRIDLPNSVNRKTRYELNKSATTCNRFDRSV